jgi:hypothetical protein
VHKIPLTESKSKQRCCHRMESTGPKHYPVANLVVGMGGERGNKCVGVSEQERCLYKDTNGLSKYAWSVHNNWD